MYKSLAVVVAGALVAPALGQVMAVGVTDTGLLARFSTGGGSLTTSVLAGLNPGEVIVGIDQRLSPMTYPLSLVSNQNRVFSLPSFGLGGALQLKGTSDIPLDLTAAGYGMDANPNTDRIRVVDTNGGNRRLFPGGAGGLGIGVDPPLSYNDGSGLVPRAVGVAFTSPILYGGPPASGTFREFIIDSARDMLVEVGSMAGGNASFDAGVCTPIGALGIDVGDQVGFDIAPGLGGIAVLSTVVGGNTRFYRINLQTGFATFTGEIGGLAITDLTMPVGPSPSAVGLLALAGVAAGRRRR